MILSILFAGVVAVAFGVLFNVRGKNLFLAGLNGLIGFAVFSAMVHMGTASYIAVFLASVAMAAYAEIAARIRKTPTSLFLVAALIPIVPGGGIFQFVLHLLQDGMEQAASVGIITLMETGAIAIGVILVSSIIRVVPRRR